MHRPTVLRILCRVVFLSCLALVLLGASCNGDPVTLPPEVAALPLEDLAACKAIERLVAETSDPSAPLFRRTDDACEAVPARDLDRLVERTRLYADASCRREVDFRGTAFEAFCGYQLLGNDRTREFVGHPRAWFDAADDEGTGRLETPWTLARETTLQVAALDQTRLPRPYVKRVEYRQVDGCSLGLHIYVPHPAAENLKPALVLHGGGWRFRGAAAVAGLGTVVPQLTSRGHAVFAPFFRLTGDSDGPAACRGARGEDIVGDVEAALDWVLAHGSEFGVDPAAERVALVGQSSGGHLATWLTVHRSESVRRALLLYPLVDVPFLVDELGGGGLFEGRFDSGEPLLLAFLAEPGVVAASDLDPETDFARRNSFVAQIEAEPDAFADLDMIHGDADANVPVELSVRLCAAKDPSRTPPDGAWAGGDADLACGDGGRATIVAGGSHVLDLRCFSGEKAQLLALVDDELGGLCAAGSEAQEARVRNALRAAYDRF